MTTDIKEMNGKVVIRMSGSGHCVRARTAELSGKYEHIARPTPSWLMESAEEGKMHEIWIKDELYKKGFVIFDEQLELKLEYPEFILLGHIDGKDLMPVIEERKFIELLEIKSMSQFEFQRWHNGRFSEFPQYASQLSCYATATELNNIRYIVKNRSSGYKDIQMLNHDTFPVKQEFSKVVENCNIVVKNLEHNTLPEVEYDGASLQCRRCAYDRLCVKDIVDLHTLINNEELIATTKRYREASAKLAEYTKAVNDEKAIIKSHLLAAGVKKVLVNELALQLITVKPRFDYPKKSLLQFVTKDELDQIAIPKEGYSFVRIDDKTSETVEYKKNDED
jgi:hypothetical protein